MACGGGHRKVGSALKKHLVIASILSLALAAVLGLIFWNADFIPNPSSAERTHIDYLLRIMFAIGGAIFALVLVFFVYSLVFFRRRPGEKGDGAPLVGNVPLEIVWTVVPLIIVMYLGVYGSIVLGRMTTPPPPGTALNVNVTAARFSWSFSYPDYGFTTFELRLPVDRPVVFRIDSEDVVHSFWVPEFGPKQDAVPGMTTEFRLTPTVEGSYLVRCAELCGAGHTFMTAPVAVVSGEEFQDWVQRQQQPGQTR